MSLAVKPAHFATQKWLAAVLAAITVNMVAACALTSASAATAMSERATATSAQDSTLTPSTMTPSPISGISLVEHNHAFAYVSADGRYQLKGDLIDQQTHRNLTEDARRADRQQAVAGMDAITFAPTQAADTKYVVTVFSDVDCGYCRQLHSQIADYNARGIAVRYLAWPRSGPGTASWKKAEAVWCAKDRDDAMTAATLGQELPAASCTNAVAAEYELGVELGVHGTPTMILPNGSLSAGYLPPPQLVSKLEAQAADAPALPAKEVVAH
jgi:thiol:disulfide interchange protein DsbC